MAVRVALARSFPRQSLRQVVRQRPHARFNSSQATPPPPPPPPPPPHRRSWTLPIVGVLALAGASGYYYYKQSGYADGVVPASKSSIAAGKKGAKQPGKPGDYQAVYDAVAESLEEGAEEYDDGSFGPVILRLAWHASGTYDKETGTGGSNGATMVRPYSSQFISFLTLLVAFCS
jgi:cytochrome c peroxidase